MAEDKPNKKIDSTQYNIGFFAGFAKSAAHGPFAPLFTMFDGLDMYLNKLLKGEEQPQKVQEEQAPPAADRPAPDNMHKSIGKRGQEEQAPPAAHHTVPDSMHKSIGKRGDESTLPQAETKPLLDIIFESFGASKPKQTEQNPKQQIPAADGETLEINGISFTKGSTTIGGKKIDVILLEKTDPDTGITQSTTISGTSKEMSDIWSKLKEIDRQENAVTLKEADKIRMLDEALPREVTTDPFIKSNDKAPKELAEKEALDIIRKFEKPSHTTILPIYEQMRNNRYEEGSNLDGRKNPRKLIEDEIPKHLLQSLKWMDPDKATNPAIANNESVAGHGLHKTDKLKTSNGHEGHS